MRDPRFSTLLFAPLIFITSIIPQLSQTYPWSKTLGLLTLGVLLWILTEYLIHRYAFHLKNFPKALQTMFSKGHHTHHHHPKDPFFVVIPPIGAILVGILVFGSLVLLTQSWSDASIIYSSFLMGYLAWEWVHYAAHWHQPKTYIGKYLQRYHLAHHFQQPNRCYGVTSPFGDMIFGTALKERDISSKFMN